MLTSRFGALERNSNWNQHVRLFQPRRALPPDEPIFLLDMPNPQFGFYLRFPLRRALDWETFLDRLPVSADRGPIYILSRESYVPRLERLGELARIDHCAQPHPVSAYELRLDPAMLAQRPASLSRPGQR
jgi:hypothetical protein